MKRCKFCGKLFKNKDKRFKYCSPNCKQKGESKRIKEYLKEYYQRNKEKIKKRAIRYQQKPKVKKRARKRREKALPSYIQLGTIKLSMRNLVKNVNILKKYSEELGF